MWKFKLLRLTAFLTAGTLLAASSCAASLDDWPGAIGIAAAVLGGAFVLSGIAGQAVAP